MERIKIENAYDVLLETNVTNRDDGREEEEGGRKEKAQNRNKISNSNTQVRKKEEKLPERRKDGRDEQGSQGDARFAVDEKGVKRL